MGFVLGVGLTLMTKEDWVRLGQHIPVGLFPLWVYSWDKLLGIVLLAIFIIYEAFNDWRKHDKSYKDVLGISWGAALGAIILWLVHL